MFAFGSAIFHPSYCLDVVCNDRSACLQVLQSFYVLEMIFHINVCLVGSLLTVTLSEIFCICDVKLLLKEAHELMSQLCYTFLYIFLIQYC